MVDIMDMEDIFSELIHPVINNIWVNAEELNKAEIKFQYNILVNKLIKEVEDFVEAQQTIACANCKGYKFKNLKERWQVG